jgi:hypothetical protein
MLSLIMIPFLTFSNSLYSPSPQSPSAPPALHHSLQYIIVLCDLYESGILYHYTMEDYVVLGPGAKQGLGLIFRTLGSIHNSGGTGRKSSSSGGGGDLSIDRRLVNYLYGIQESVYDNLALQFPGMCQRPLSLINIEHSLCEFYKYFRLLPLQVEGGGLLTQKQ